MLDSVKIARRQSEIRQVLSELVGKEKPTDDETRSMDDMDREYRSNETRYRAALVAEDDERRDAGAELETRDGKAWSDLVGRFELRQVALALDEGRSLDGATAEIVTELRGTGGYRGIPVPLEALEIRAGETLASGVPDPIKTGPVIDRLFAESMAVKMGGRMINVGVGEMEFPVTTSSVTAGWASSETGNVAGPQAYTTADRPLAPDHNLGVQMKITRKSLKQAGAGLEQAIRRDMAGAINQELDRAVFLGSGSAGEPLGIIAGASTYGITETAVAAEAAYAAFRAAAVRFMVANAASGPKAVNLLLRPEVFDGMDADLISSTAVSEWDRLVAKIGNVYLNSNALAAPVGTPLESKALLTTTVGGVAPFFVGTWGAIDLIRDPYTDAQSGGLRLTGLMTADVTVSRTVQLEVLTEVQ